MSIKEAAECIADGVGDRGNSILSATPELTNKVFQYAEEYSTTLPDHITAFYSSIATGRSDATMLTSNFQSQFNILLARLHGSRRVLEIGAYVGYSAMVWSHAVGPNGLVTALELFPEFANIAKGALASRGITNVEVLSGDASTLLLDLDLSSPYDLVFIDANKDGYPSYLNLLLEQSQPGSPRRLLRPGALILADNILRFGHVADGSLTTSYWLSEEAKEAEISSLRKFNDLCKANSRLESFLLPLWDGVNMIRLVD
ncbi:S-adenosyl-L-methionine-dependent methyltransferase [Camillea tinctor]|nr:S-adenosyl-L-methionine-dependent methyltransferase [Camillea tinctor]